MLFHFKMFRCEAEEDTSVVCVQYRGLRYSCCELYYRLGRMVAALK